MATAAILNRPVGNVSHLTDLAIVQRVREDDVGGPATGDKGAQAAHVLVSAILALGGVPERSCSIGALYKAAKRAHRGIVAA